MQWATLRRASRGPRSAGRKVGVASCLLPAQGWTEKSRRLGGLRWPVFGDLKNSNLSIALIGIWIWGGDNIPLLSRLPIAMALASDVAPLLSKERADEPGGLWATKQYGDLKVSAADLDYFSSSLVDVGVLYCAER